MSNLSTILLILHVLLALGIITLVLLQKGKGAAEGAAFGGGASASVFGASGSSNFLSKSTAICATLFFLNSVALAYLAANRDVPDSVVDSVIQVEDSQEPIVVDSLDDLIPAADAPVADDGGIVPPPADGAATDLPPAAQ